MGFSASASASLLLLLHATEDFRFQISDFRFLISHQGAWRIAHGIAVWLHCGRRMLHHCPYHIILIISLPAFFLVALEPIELEAGDREGRVGGHFHPLRRAGHSDNAALQVFLVAMKMHGM